MRYILPLGLVAIVATLVAGQRLLSESGYENDGSKIRDSIVSKQSKEPYGAFILKAAGLAGSAEDADQAVEWLEANWSDQALPYFIEIRRFMGQQFGTRKLGRLFTEKTGVGWNDFDGMNQYVWAKPIQNTPEYLEFKQLVHQPIDQRFVNYFEPDRSFDIRLDEIAWGGVVQDGIPPLRGPKMLNVEDANYLDDSNVVFGISINGDHRAYPKRILAWHEMFVDTVGEVPLAGVYCTLCGSVIAYDTRHGGVNHQLGTSGFLYRSNKLMYDKATQSMWSTLEGKPVGGPLLGQGIRLTQYPVVTTTWGAWKKRHPNTKVLSLDTGHRRNYDEGNAYQSYFATDERMFETPFHDDRLDNKAEVLALRFLAESEQPTVIHDEFLLRNPVYQKQIDGQSFVIFTTSEGANRVYEASGVTFQSWDGEMSAVDNNGQTWRVEEHQLVASNGRNLARLPAHRAFWFGWHGAFPDTRLIR